MSEHDQGRGRWGDAGGLDGAITGSPRFSVTGGGTRLRVEYRVEGRGVVELTYAPKGEEGEEEISVDQPRLPWRQEVTMRGPVAIPVLSATLDEDGAGPIWWSPSTGGSAPGSPSAAPPPPASASPTRGCERERPRPVRRGPLRTSRASGQ